MKIKIFSRKFILSLAAFLGSIGASIVGLKVENETLATVGIICMVLSTAIYAAAEAYVDAAAATSKHISIEENVSRETSKEK